MKINSRLTLGEDVADLGGTILAFHAWKEATRGQELKPRTVSPPTSDSSSASRSGRADRRRDETARLAAQTDPHSPLR